MNVDDVRSEPSTNESPNSHSVRPGESSIDDASSPPSQRWSERNSASASGHGVADRTRGTAETLIWPRPRREAGLAARSVSLADVAGGDAGEAHDVEHDAADPGTVAVAEERNGLHGVCRCRDRDLSV